MLRRLSKNDKTILESKNHLGQTLMHLIFEKPFRFSIYFHRIVDFLLSNGVNPNSLNSLQETPLITAARNSQRQCISYAFDWNSKVTLYNQNKKKQMDEDEKFKPFDFNCQDPVTGFSMMHFIALDPSLILISDLIKADLVDPLLLDNRHKLALAYIPKMYLSSKKILLGYFTQCLQSHLNGTFKRHCPELIGRADKMVRSMSNSLIEENSNGITDQPPPLSLLESKERKFLSFINSRFSNKGNLKNSDHGSSVPSLKLDYKTIKITSANKLRTLKSFAHDSVDYERGNEDFLDQDFISGTVNNPSRKSPRKRKTKVRLFADFTKQNSYHVNFNSDWLKPAKELQREASIVSVGQEIGKKLDKVISAVSFRNGRCCKTY